MHGNSGDRPWLRAPTSSNCVRSVCGQSNLHARTTSRRASKSFCLKLYPDNAHFIYELLQNAEDALATTVEFALEADRLTVSHDGKRPFSLADIESITGHRPVDQEGRPDEDRQVRRRVQSRLRLHDSPRRSAPAPTRSRSRISSFPPRSTGGLRRTGRRSPSPSTARTSRLKRHAAEVERDSRTSTRRPCCSSTTSALSPTNCLTGLSGSSSAVLSTRGSLRSRRSEGDDFVESHWLRLTGHASVDGPNPSALTVAAAFRVESADGARNAKAKQADSQDAAPRRSSSPSIDGDVSIYFPAVKESSGLRFHIHAPFASTVDRASLRDDPGNIRLVEDIARLIVEALPGMCADGLIDDNFLSAPRIGDFQIGYPYNQIQEAITEAFSTTSRSRPLGNRSSFRRCPDAGREPERVPQLVVDPTDLPTLSIFARISTTKTRRWIRDRDGRAGKFLAGLDTIEFGWEELKHSCGCSGVHHPRGLAQGVRRGQRPIEGVVRMARYKDRRLDSGSLPTDRLRCASPRARLRT